MERRSARILRMLNLPSNSISTKEINEVSSSRQLPRQQHVEDASNNINIISQVIIRERTSTSNSLSDALEHSQDNCHQNRAITSTSSYEDNCLNRSDTKLEFDEWSDYKSSGSEYIPSDHDQSDGEESSTSNVQVSTSTEFNLDISAKNDDQSNRQESCISNVQVPTSTKSNISAMMKYDEQSNSQKSSISNVKVLISTESNINISAAKKANNKRIRNKGHACYFCQKIILNSARHLEVVHGSETEVAKVLAMPKNSRARRDAFAVLIRSGDFYHNMDVLSIKKGELILIRRPTVEESKLTKYSDYGPCPHCLGFLLKKHIWHHAKSNCNLKRNNTIDNKSVIAESNAILSSTFGAEFSSDFVSNISSRLRDDDIGNFCKEDNLIMHFGAMQFEKYGTTQCELIRQSMRQLGRFTLQLRNIDKSTRQLSDYLKPEKFDLIVQATKSLCITHQTIAKRPEFEVPSLALKIGHALKKCIAIKRGISLKNGNLRGNEVLLSLLSIMELEWSIRVSSNALATLYNRKMNATQLLPLTSDLIKIGKFINDRIIIVKNDLLENPSLSYWTLLASLCLCKVILFNKRRSGEASRMKVTDFLNRPKWSDQCTEELKNSLTDFERKLAQNLILVEIIGKRGRRVPVLLKADTKDSIDLLIKTRDIVGISKENPYVFARTGNSTGSIRGHDCLRKFCTEAELERPENVSSTKLRKYVATVCQVFDLSENEYDWLARHLGHDIRVHRDFYRLHESAVELTKVSRLLMVVDEGQANKFAGKKLDDINLEEMPHIEEDVVHESEIDDQNETDDEDEDLEEVHPVLILPTPVESKNKISKKRGKKITKKQEKTISKIQEKKIISKKQIIKRPWSSDEKDAVLKYFKIQIRNGIVPGKADCCKCIENNTSLKARSWTDVKFCVKNQIDKIKKQQQ